MIERRKLLNICWILTVTNVVRCSSLDTGHCRSALGMQSGEIPDSAITASSSFDDNIFGPSQARIRTEGDGGAWCPKEQILKNGDEYLEIDLGQLKVITLVETQGRFGNGQGQEYVEQYRLQYQREDFGRWFTFNNRRGAQIFQGNANTYMSELRDVDPPLVARRIRFVPYSVHPKHVCLRVELYGCTWKDGLVSYDIPQGERRGVDIDLSDLTYDGLVDGHRLTGGLGQLTDGELGTWNFGVVDSRGTGIKGYDWVGWSNDSVSSITVQSSDDVTSGAAVELNFRFDAMRNFSWVRLRANNMHTQDVRVFRAVNAYISRDGAVYAPLERYVTQLPPVGKTTGTRTSKTSSESPVDVIVPLNFALGRFLRLQLVFNARWILISEVEFNSEYVDVANLIDEQAADKHSSVGSHAGDVSLSNDVVSRAVTNVSSAGAEQSLLTNRTRLRDEYLGILIGSLATMVILLLTIAAILAWRRRHQFGGVRRRVLKCLDNVPTSASGASSLPQHCVVQNATSANGKTVNGARYEFVGTMDVDCSPDYQLSQSLNCCGGNGETVGGRRKPVNGGPPSLPELPVTPPDSTSDTFTPTDYAGKAYAEYADVRCVTSDAGLWMSQQRFVALPSKQFATLHGSSVSGLKKQRNASGLERSGNGNSMATLLGSVAAVSAVDCFQQVPKVSADSVRFLQKLDDGQFGEIYLSEIGQNTGSFQSATQLAVVKMLQPHVDDKTRYRFQRLIQSLLRLSDCDQVARCFGVYAGNADWIVVEYSIYGDLKGYLRQHRLMTSQDGGRQAAPSSSPVLSHGTLIYMASQIASAMKHLEVLNIVHGNLATRSCIVGDLHNVKVTDIGDSAAGCTRYPEDYSAPDFAEAPIQALRWMAWETVFKGECTSKSDVWSFGVTLWEILTLARHRRPFDDQLQTDADVLSNLEACSRGMTSSVCQLTSPNACPREIYDLMCECWQREPTSRPSFREVHMFLQRKNVGYQPTTGNICS